MINRNDPRYKKFVLANKDFYEEGKTELTCRNFDGVDERLTPQLSGTYLAELEGRGMLKNGRLVRAGCSELSSYKMLKPWSGSIEEIFERTGITDNSDKVKEPIMRFFPKS
jgi:hypothetical protein